MITALKVLENISIYRCKSKFPEAIYQLIAATKFVVCNHAIFVCSSFTDLN